MLMAKQPMIAPQLPHPKMLGRRAAVKALAGEYLTLREAFQEEVIRPVVRAFVVQWVKNERRTFDRKARKRKRAARARCGHRRR